MESLFNSWNILIGYVLSFSLLQEHICHICILIRYIFINRLNIPNNLSILPSTTRLLFMQVSEFSSASYRFSVIDSWISNNNINIIFSFNSFTVNKQMKLAHSGYYNFFVFLIVINSKCRIFPLKSCQSLQKRI